MCFVGKGDWERGEDLVAKALGCDNGDFIADTLVGAEIQCQFGVVALDYYFGGLLDGLHTVSLGAFLSYPEKAL